MKRLIFAAACLLAAAISIDAFAAPANVTPSLATSLPKSAQAVDFADPRPVMDVGEQLVPYRGAAIEQDGSTWYVLTAVNHSNAVATRVLQAAEIAGASLRIFPVSTRPAILEVTSPDPSVTVTGTSAYARHSFKIAVPPSATVGLAIRVQNADPRPSLLAWTEPALASQHRSLAIFIAAVAGLIGASALITGGLAAMTAHAAPRWAAFTLLAILLARLSASGMFDTSITTSVGGPYGLSAMFAGFALAAGIRLVDTVVPLTDMWPSMRRPLDLTLYGLVALSLLAYLGVPAAGVLVEIAVLFGSATVSAYLVHNGRNGARPARVMAPSATIFALVTLATAVASVGGFGDNFAAPAIVGGFSAAGALLMALAIVAGEGLVAVPHWRVALANLHHHQPHMPSVKDAQPIEQTPQTTAALAAIGASHQGVFDLDIKKQIVNLSEEAANLIGFQQGARQFAHDDWKIRIHPEDREVYIQAIEDFQSHVGIAFRIEFRVKSEAGRYPWFELRATMLGDAPPAVRCLGLMADITTRKEAEPQPEQQQPDKQQRDPLTGLGNRVALMEEFDRIDFANAVFAMLDVDRFKSIHASLGDAGADSILAKIGERLASRFSSRAQIFRVGGDSFAALMSDANLDPSTIGAELADTCAPPHTIDDRNVFAPASVGVALGKDARDPLDLVKNADLALIQAKREGGARACVYNPEMEATTRADSVVLEAELRRALDEDQLDVFYQPIVRLEDRAVVGFEALLRWHHPTKGLVVPADFIAHSEETGLIVSLGRFALERAAKELANWQRFFPLDPPLFCSVNLSRRQLLDTEFEGILRTVFARDRIARNTLKLELTEAAVAATTDAKPMLDKLRLLGAGIAIDDFGTGLSNFAQLKDLPFDVLKIDRSFLARHSGQDDAKDAAVVRSIVSLARDLGRSVIVEGVETEHDAQWVKGLGCDYAQGFCFSQPLPSGEALNFLAMHFDEKTAVKASGAAGL
jgi:diguanylate cyclase (GGDEF)-like protein/PAS domain S-box-containing protein